MAAPTADIPADIRNGIKTLLANGVTTTFISAKPAITNCLIIYLVAALNKIPVFSKDLITFIIYFVSFPVRVIPKPSLNVKYF